MSTTPTTAVAKKEEKAVEYVPFGSDDKITLTINLVRNTVAVPTKSGVMPSDKDCIKFIMLCKSRRLNPWEGDCFMIGYDGREGPSFSLITAHQAFLKRAETHPEYDGMESGIIVQTNDVIQEQEGDFYLPGQNVLGGWARVHFKTRRHPMYKRIRMERFNKGFGEWGKDAAGMICKCAEADALRSSFPTMLGGLYTKEEMDSRPPELAKPIFSTPAIEAPPAKADDDPVERFKAACIENQIELEDALEELRRRGLMPKECVTLEQFNQDMPDAIPLLLEQFANIVNKVKGEA